MRYPETASDVILYLYVDLLIRALFIRRVSQLVLIATSLDSALLFVSFFLKLVDLLHPHHISKLSPFTRIDIVQHSTQSLLFFYDSIILTMRISIFYSLSPYITPHPVRTHRHLSQSSVSTLYPIPLLNGPFNSSHTHHRHLLITCFIF